MRLLPSLFVLSETAVVAGVMLFLGTGALKAAVRLGLREAQVLVEHTPAFLRASEKGYCPQTSDGAVNGDSATVVVRGECRYLGVVGDFYVDLRTGVVAQDPGPAEVRSQELVELRNRLFTMRAEARLVAPEAACLISKLPNVPLKAIKESCRRIMIVSEDDNVILGRIDDICPNPTDSANLQLTVDRYSGAVANAQNGEVYRSAPLDAVRKNLVEIHSPARLTLEDAKGLAIGILSAGPESMNRKCVQVDVDPVHNADEIWLQVRWGCAAEVSVRRFSVNVLTGASRIIGSNVVLDSVRIVELRERALREARARKIAAAKMLENECH
jgi:hypothetical protein